MLDINSIHTQVRTVLKNSREKLYFSNVMIYRNSLWYPRNRLCPNELLTVLTNIRSEFSVAINWKHGCNWLPDVFLDPVYAYLVNKVFRNIPVICIYIYKRIWSYVNKKCICIYICIFTNLAEFRLEIRWGENTCHIIHLKVWFFHMNVPGIPVVQGLHINLHQSSLHSAVYIHFWIA